MRYLLEISILVLGTTLVQCGEVHQSIDFLTIVDKYVEGLEDMTREYTVEEPKEKDANDSAKYGPGGGPGWYPGGGYYYYPGWPAKTPYYLNHQAVLDECVWRTVQNLRFLYVLIETFLVQWKTYTPLIAGDMTLATFWNKYFISPTSCLFVFTVIVKKLIFILEYWIDHYASKKP